MIKAVVGINAKAFFIVQEHAANPTGEIDVRLLSSANSFFSSSASSCSSCSSSSAAAPHILGAPTPKSRDLTMVTALASRCADAVRDVGVDHQEDLVVPFGV